MYRLYTDPRNKTIQLVWLSGGHRQVELCFQFEWLGTLKEEVANAKVQLIAETGPLYAEDQADRNLVERVVW